MTKKITVLIPCYKNCKTANKLKEELKKQVFKNFKTVIVHNGCVRKNSYSFCNKAKALNKKIESIKTKYVINVDSDVSVSKHFIGALYIAIENQNLDFVSAVQLRLDTKNNIMDTSYDVEYNGAGWIARTEMLKQNKLPENVLVEDTAYVEILKKKKIKLGIAHDAILYALPEISFDRMISQVVRYSIGSIQMVRFNAKYAIDVVLLFFLFIVNIYLIFNYPFAYSIYISFLIVLLYYILEKDNYLGKQLFLLFFKFTFLSPIAMCSFILKRRIW